MNCICEKFLRIIKTKKFFVFDGPLLCLVCAEGLEPMEIISDDDMSICEEDEEDEEDEEEQ